MPGTLTPRPKIRHAMTATAFGFVTARNAWRAWYRGLRDEARARRERAR